jgi:hypothetical protein
LNFITHSFHSGHSFSFFANFHAHKALVASSYRLGSERSYYRILVGFTVGSLDTRFILNTFTGELEECFEIGHVSSR